MAHTRQVEELTLGGSRAGGLTRREFLGAAMAGGVGLGMLGRLPTALAADAAAAQGRPNVILAMADDHGWGDVGYNSRKGLSIHTPTLDDMAGKGIRFNRFYAAGPVCSPTRGSCMTGRHPDRYGVFSWGYDMPLEELTLAEVLGPAGYATGHFGKWHLGGIPTEEGKATRTNRGGRQFAKPPHPGNQGFQEWFSYWNFFDLNPPAFYHNGQAAGPLEGDGSDITVDRAVAWIRKIVAEKRPFLAVVWFGNPHLPHRALDKDKAHYASLPANLQEYYGEISGIDRAMGTLRQALRDLGIADNTLLWFCSDNGCTPIGNNNDLRGNKGSLWEGGVRVPGILEWPARVRKPFATDVPAVTSDFFPTILELLGVRADKPTVPLDGISLVPLIDGKMTERPRPIAFEVRSAKGEPTWATLTDNRWKLHKRYGKGGAATWELYDLPADAGEKTDLAGQQPQVVERMKAELEKWQASVENSLAGKDYPQTGG